MSYFFSSIRSSDPETRFPAVERYVVGRFSSLARLPVLLATTAGIITKIAIKALIIAPTESIINLGAYIYAKATKEPFKYTSFWGADDKGFTADLGNLQLTLQRIRISIKRVILAPSRKGYEGMNFALTVKQSGRMVFTNFDFQADVRKQQQDFKLFSQQEKAWKEMQFKKNWEKYAT